MRTHWFDFLTASSVSPNVKKTRWKILREGEPFEALCSSYGLAHSWNIVRFTGSENQGAVKVLLRSVDHSDLCEMVVLFPSGRRATVCVSSQIGCGVGCVFCATGTMGFRRNLNYQEILEQVAIARSIASEHGRHLRNVVYMGMGEPLHNTDAVSASLDGLIDDRGFGVSPKSITVSTSGVPMSMTALAIRFPRVRIALSLHSARTDSRRELMPKASKDLGSLRAAIQTINTVQFGAPVWIEYILLADKNDQLEDAEELVRFCENLNVEINLIPYNEIQSLDNAKEGIEPSDVESIEHRMPLKMSSRETQTQFAQRLRNAGIKTTIRNSFGSSTDSACGQLALRQTPQSLKFKEREGSQP